MFAQLICELTNCAVVVSFYHSLRAVDLSPLWVVYPTIIVLVCATPICVIANDKFQGSEGLPSQWTTVRVVKVLVVNKYSFD